MHYKGLIRVEKFDEIYFEKFSKKYCNIFLDIIYYRGLLKAKKWKVTELTENFHGELSSPDEGEGIRLLLLCAQKRETHGAVYTVSKTHVHVESSRLGPLVPA